MSKTQITNYGYGFVSSQSSNRAYLRLYENSKMVCFIFFFTEKITSFPFINNEGTVFLEYNIRWMDRIIDMLRNEKPVYLTGTNNSYTISTEEEPIGEGEMPG